MSNNYILYKTADDAYCLSFDSLDFIIGKKGKVYKSDSFAFSFKRPIYLELRGAVLLDKSSLMFKRLMQISPEEVPSFTILNYGFD